MKNFGNLPGNPHQKIKQIRTSLFLLYYWAVCRLYHLSSRVEPPGPDQR